MKPSKLLPVSRPLQVGLAAGSAAIVILFAVIAVVSLRSQRAALAGVKLHHRVIEASERVISRMAEAEVAQRDYVLTGAQPYRDDYDHVVGLLYQDLAALRGVSEDGDDSIAADRMTQTVENRLERLKLSQDLRDRLGMAAATRALDPASGAGELEAMRAFARSRVADEEQELAEQATLLRSRSIALLWIFFAGSAVAVLLAGGLSVLLSAYARERQATAAELEETNEQLREQAVELELQRTELEEATEELRHSEERLRALVEHTTDIIAVVDPDGIIHYESPSVERVLGYGPDGRVGHDLFEYVHPEDVPALRTAFARLLESDTPLELSSHMRVRRRDGQWRRLSAQGQNLLAHAAIKGIVVTSHDITESRLLEEQLRQAQKMEAIGRMAGGIAHDFNNVITSMQGYLDLASEALPPSSPAVEDLREVSRATEHAARLSQQLLAFSRRDVDRPRVINVNDIIGDMTRMLRRLVGEDVALQTSLEPELVAVTADPTQIQQVVMNLAVNARDAMPVGGRLRIETRTVEVDEAWCRTEADLQPGRYVLLRVADTGQGMDRETQQQIFEPFFTTKEKGKGTGLGLSTVYTIVKQHQGVIRVDSAEGRGTTFSIYLPAAPAAKRPQSRRVRNGRRTTRSGAGTETVLVVEDETAVRNLARRLLTGHGYRVLDAKDGPDALRICESFEGSVDLVLTDVIMPHMSGRDVVEALTPHYPDMRVMYTSGYAAETIRERGALGSCDAFLEKPFSADQLLHKVREVLDQTCGGDGAAEGSASRDVRRGARRNGGRSFPEAGAAERPSGSAVQPDDLRRPA